MEKELQSSSSKIFNKNPYDHFSVGVCNFDNMEILLLNHQKHQRIKYQWNSSGVKTFDHLIA